MVFCLQVLKLYAWELSFQEKILEIRNRELKVLRKAAYLNAAASFSWTCAPFLVCYCHFLLHLGFSGHVFSVLPVVILECHQQFSDSCDQNIILTLFLISRKFVYRVSVKNCICHLVTGIVLFKSLLAKCL